MKSRGKKILKKLEALGHGFFYVMLYCFGQRGAYLSLAPVIFVYVFFSRRIHAVTRPYRSLRFPEHKGLRAWLDTFRIVHSFGQVLVDRGWLGLQKKRQLTGFFEKSDELIALVENGRGCVLLTAHVGNWQTALSHICKLPVPVNSLMHYEEEAVAKHYFDLRNEPCPFKIIKSDGYLGGMVESTAAIGRGELVTIMGDRWAGGPYVTVDFLGRPAPIPAAAYSLAASTGAPVAVLLAAKTGRTTYRLKVWDIFYPQHGERKDRRRDMEQWAEKFTSTLESYVGENPYQWYNFYDFWDQPAEPANKTSNGSAQAPGRKL